MTPWVAFLLDMLSDSCWVYVLLSFKRELLEHMIVGQLVKVGLGVWLWILWFGLYYFFGRVGSDAFVEEFSFILLTLVLGCMDAFFLYTFQGEETRKKWKERITYEAKKRMLKKYARVERRFILDLWKSKGL